ncbi:hypothetical protein Q4485_02080 [Granulosicoccaceae sp. 1_MG-2023]|nr:hypothetical protein [Granulosicoccaceae sp. 1_MG-2023]
MNYLQARMLSALMLLALLTACVVPQSSYRAGGFSYERMQKYGLAVGGVVSASGAQPLYQYLDWSKRLQTALHETRPSLPLVGAQATRERLGNNYKPVLDGFQQYNTVGRAELEMLRRAGLISRYVMFARIERDEAQKLPVQVLPYKDEKGRYFEDRQNVVKATRREVVVTGQIYDLETGRQVWQERLVSAPRNQSRFVRYHGDSAAEALVVSAANILSNGRSEPAQPKAPSSEEALNYVFTGLAEKLPGLY